ncbi:hypothetical protein PC39_14407 [Salinisphaera sp. PC39]|uniref:hypothetical protein n=1 Tax=Salinisphaera sp. PC39 TaxID=1304156 RepID=UPI00333FEC76
MNDETRLQASLLALRLTVFLVMAMWTVDKFVNPGHAAGVFENFYFIPGLGAGAFLLIGLAEAALLLAFVAGVLKRFTYGAVLLLHAASTLSSFPRYIAPFEGPNLLFFAAWPMLAACLALYLLRDRDRLLAVA